MDVGKIKEVFGNMKTRLKGVNFGQRGWRIVLCGVLAYGAISNISNCYNHYKLKKLQVDVDLVKKRQKKY